MSIRLKILVIGTDLDILLKKQEQPCLQPIQLFEPSLHKKEKLILVGFGSWFKWQTKSRTLSHHLSPVELIFLLCISLVFIHLFLPFPLFNPWLNKTLTWRWPWSGTVHVNKAAENVSDEICKVKHWQTLRTVYFDKLLAPNQPVGFYLHREELPIGFVAELNFALKAVWAILMCARHVEKLGVV